MNDHEKASKETGYSITNSREINLIPDRYQQEKQRGMRQKNKREHVAPQSGIQMLFVVLCSLRSTGPSYASPP
ncbi:hypothetical protein DBR09_06925 [Aeromonas sp. HMWF016]|nr:hypothetical protein DBR09_06925 [Aeromonas sp. HMWF016]